MNALARVFEAAGLSTVVINPMFAWGPALGAPRTLGVEFPFGHPCGLPGEPDLQMRVVRAALDLLVNSPPPGPVLEELTEPWPGDFDIWKKAWHPLEPSPLIRFMREQAAARAKEQRGG